MIFALIGGDERSLMLRKMLTEDGHTVRVWGLEKAAEGGERSLSDCAWGADCVILPLPVSVGKKLNAPFSDTETETAELLRTMPGHGFICAGKLSIEEKSILEQRGVRYCDYFRREDFSVLNAALTAEGAIENLMRITPTSIFGSRVLVCGYGRIGKLLASKLQSLGARVCVLARSAGALAHARCLGMDTLNMRKKPSLSGFDAVINTIPAVVFGEKELWQFGTAELIELASPPYGFDMAAAEAMGKKVLIASSLPGKCSPVSAAEIIKDTIYNVLEE